jgi:hypothetical protein
MSTVLVLVLVRRQPGPSSCVDFRRRLATGQEVVGSAWPAT